MRRGELKAETKDGQAKPTNPQGVNVQNVGTVETTPVTFHRITRIRTQHYVNTVRGA